MTDLADEERRTFYPAPFVWDAGAGVMRVAPRFLGVCARQYQDGQEYILVKEDVRSKRNHNHFFATVADAWKTLPETLVDEYPSPEHLRKRALIATGYADMQDFVCQTPEEAHKLAAYLRPLDEYALISVRFNVVRHWRAQSQSKKAMGSKVFTESKQKVLDHIAGLLGTDTETMLATLKKAA